MYGDGLRRIVEAIEASREAGATILDQLAQDGAVASLLLIHDLYPVSLQERVVEALDTVRPYMESHGGNVELVEIDDGVARLALQGSCNGCAASRATLELAIKQALDEHAPDLVGLEVEGVTTADARSVGTGAGAFELPIVHSAAELPLAPEPPRWVPLDTAARARAGASSGADRRRGGAGAGKRRRDAAGLPGRVRGVRRARCMAVSCTASMLRCRACEVDFDLPRAGRAAGGEPLQLAPVPLLRGRRRPGGGVSAGSTPSSPRASGRRRWRGCDRSAQAGAAAPARTAARRARGSAATSATRGSRRPPPSAPSRGAADRVRVRGLLGAALR